MSLVSWDYFENTYLGKGVSQADFPRLDVRSEDMLDALTRGALSRFTSLSADQQTLVKKAICAQIEYYGAYTTQVGFAEEKQGFTVGKVTVSGGSRESVKTYYSPIAITYLEMAGLLTRSVGVLC